MSGSSLGGSGSLLARLLAIDPTDPVIDCHVGRPPGKKSQNESGLPLRASAEDLDTKSRSVAHFEAFAGLTARQVERLEAEAEANAAEDQKRLEHARLRLKAEGLVHAMQHVLNTSELGTDLELAITDACDELAEALKSGTEQALRASMEELDGLAHLIGDPDDDAGTAI